MEKKLFIGKVVEVFNSDLKIKIDHSFSNHQRNINFYGKKYKGIVFDQTIGINDGFLNFFGKIKKDYIDENEDRYVFITINKIQDYENNIKQWYTKNHLPSIGSKAFLIDEEQRKNIISKVEYKNNDSFFELGKYSEDKNINYYLKWTKIFLSHFSIYGNTGSGKTNTLAFMLKQYFKKSKINEGKKIENYLFDFNSEYKNINLKSFNSKLKIENVTFNTRSNERNTHKLNLILEKEFLSILFLATEKTQVPVLSKAISEYKKKDSDRETKFDILTFNISKVIINRNPEIFEDINDFFSLFFNKDNNWNKEWWKNSLYNSEELVIDELLDSTPGTKDFKKKTPEFSAILKHVKARLNDKKEEINEIDNLIFLVILIFSNSVGNNLEFILPMLNRIKNNIFIYEKLFLINDENSEKIFINNEEINEKNDWNEIIYIIDLFNVNEEMKYIISSMISENVFSNLVKKDERDKNKINRIIIDEAHRVLSKPNGKIYDKNRMKEYSLNSFEKIIKEGRKFGVYLIISSQRPSEISETIISQMQNNFIHRIVNQNDIEIIKNSLPYLTEIDIKYLPTLNCGSCIVGGVDFSENEVIQVTEFKDSGMENSSKDENDFFDLNN